MHIIYIYIYMYIIYIYIYIYIYMKSSEYILGNFKTKKQDPWNTIQYSMSSSVPVWIFSWNSPM